MKMKTMLATLVAMIFSAQAFAAPGAGVVILEDSVNTQISTPASTLVAGHNGSMLFDLEVQDAVTYKLLNDGASTAGLDVIMDLGSITAGIYSAVDGDPCSVLVGLSQPSAFPLTRADASSATADCVVKKTAAPANVVSMNYAIPLRATLLKSGSKVFTVTYSRSGAIGAGSAAFTDMKIRSRVLASNASTGGSFLAGAGNVMNTGIVMADQDDVHYQVELKADLNGASAHSHYSEAILVDITLI